MNINKQAILIQVEDMLDKLESIPTMNQNHAHGENIYAIFNKISISYEKIDILYQKRYQLKFVSDLLGDTYDLKLGRIDPTYLMIDNTIRIYLNNSSIEINEDCSYYSETIYLEDPNADQQLLNGIKSAHDHKNEQMRLRLQTMSKQLQLKQEMLNILKGAAEV